jgi:DNA polymerase III delta subunit
MAARKAPEPPPPAQIAELERSLLGASPLARGYLVRGDERWFREAALSLLVEAAKRRGLEVTRFDAADPDHDLAGLLSDLSAASLFAPARFVLVRNAGALLKKEGESEVPFVNAALAFLRGRAVLGTIAIEAESLRVDHALAKAVAASGGTVLTLRKLYDSPPPWEREPDPRKVELVQWLLSRARQKSLRLDPDQAAYVVAATGNDLAALDSALDALARRGGQGVRETVGWSSGASPFQLAEDLSCGHVAASLTGIESLFRSGMRERDGSREVKPEALLSVLFGSLRSKLRQTLALARAAEVGSSLEIAGPPRSREEALKRYPLRSARAWQRILEDLAELERRTRTSRTVDASDLALLCLRWRRAPSKIRAASAAGRDVHTAIAGSADLGDAEHS